MSAPDGVYQFDPAAMFTSGPCFFVGATGSGKTNTLLSIIGRHGRKFEVVAAFAGSVGALVSLGKCLPQVAIHFPYDDTARRKLAKLLDGQQRATFRGGAKPILLIFDDLMFEGRGFVSSREFRWLIFNSRASNVWCLFTMQYCKHVPPEIRSQGFYAFLCPAKDMETRRMLVETFAPIGVGGFRSERHFFSVFDHCTRDMGCLVVDRSVLGPLGEDHPPYFWYRAPKVCERPLAFGSGALWRYNDRRYDPRWVDRPGAFGQLSSPEKKVPEPKPRARLREIPPASQRMRIANPNDRPHTRKTGYNRERAKLLVYGL